MATIRTESLPERDLTVITVAGPVDTAGFLAALESFYAAGPTRDLIWDLAEADLSAIRAADLQRVLEVARRRASARPAGRTVALAPRDLAFGIARMYEILADLGGHRGIAHAVVRTRAEADAWLAGDR